VHSFFGASTVAANDGLFSSGSAFSWGSREGVASQQLGAQHLDGDLLADERMDGAVDDAHASGADALLDNELTDLHRQQWVRGGIDHVTRQLFPYGHRLARGLPKQATRAVIALEQAGCAEARTYIRQVL
jgi:hypothetical protein